MPYAVVSVGSTTSTADFATYSSGGGVAPFADYVTSLADAGPTDNVMLSTSAALAAGIGTEVINSLILEGDASVALAGNTLRIASGGIISSGGSGSGVDHRRFGQPALDFGSNEALVSANNLLLNANITGAGGLTSFGAGTLTLLNSNSYTGTTALNAGTVAIGNNAVFGAPADNLVLSGGTLEAVDAVSLPNPFSLNNANFTIGNNVPLTFTNTGTLSGNNQITFNNTGGTTFANGLNEGVADSSLIVAGAATATVLLPSASTYTGGTTISGPVVMIGSDSSLGFGVLNLVSGSLLTGLARR